MTKQTMYFLASLWGGSILSILFVTRPPRLRS